MLNHGGIAEEWVAQNARAQNGVEYHVRGLPDVRALDLSRSRFLPLKMISDIFQITDNIPNFDMFQITEILEARS